MSQESEDEEAYCFLDVELEALHSIYINELEVTHGGKGKLTSVSIQLHPSTADNVEEQYVLLSLIFNLPIEYPDKVPEILIKNPRGLSDEKLDRIAQDLVSIAEARRGGTMLFELIECAKDHLTSGNRPSCQCAICLHGFTEDDVFTKTKCYHYFHSYCLACYVKHNFQTSGKEESQNDSQDDIQEVLCPVCRIPITFCVIDEDFPPPCSTKEDRIIISDEVLILQEKMKNMFEKQKAQGGIIDIEEEKNKFLLEISTMPSTASAQDLESEEKVPLSTSDAENEELLSTETENHKESLAAMNSNTENSIQNRSIEREADNRPQRNRYKDSKKFYINENKSRKQPDKNRFSNREENFSETTALGHSVANVHDERLSPNTRYSGNVLKSNQTKGPYSSDTNSNNSRRRENFSENESEVNSQLQKSSIPQNNYNSTEKVESQHSKYPNNYSFYNPFHHNRSGWQNRHRDFHRQRNRGGQRHNFRECETPASSSSHNADSPNAQNPVLEDDCQKSRQNFRGKPRYHPRNKNFNTSRDNAYRHHDISNKSSFDHKKDQCDMDKTDKNCSKSLVNDENIPSCENLRIESDSNSKNVRGQNPRELISEVGEHSLKSRETHNYYRPYRNKLINYTYRPNRSFPAGEKKAATLTVKEDNQDVTSYHPQRYDSKSRPSNRRPYNESSRNSSRGMKNYHNVASSTEANRFHSHITGFRNNPDTSKLRPCKDASSKASDFQPKIENNEFTDGKSCCHPVLNSTISSSSVPPPPGFTKRIVYGLPPTKPPPGFNRS